MPSSTSEPELRRAVVDHLARHFAQTEHETTTRTYSVEVIAIRPIPNTPHDVIGVGCACNCCGECFEIQTRIERDRLESLLSNSNLVITALETLIEQAH